MGHYPERVNVLAALAGVTVLAAALACGRGNETTGPTDAPAAAGPAAFVGRTACEACHRSEAAAWQRSDHARAMAKATPENVLGDFRGARFTSHTTTTSFSSGDGRSSVRTEGPDGTPADFPVAYTFGADPLQQYLIPLPGGRLQAFGIAWDARPKDRGGQRWFALYPEEKLAPGDPIHWTGREQTWNHQCAECHSTNLRKNYDLATDSYDTKWSEINISCEACHGPGSNHVAWAQAGNDSAAARSDDAKGLVTRLARPEGAWRVRDDERGIAAWTGAPRTAAELDTCAPCHARRRTIAAPDPYGRPFLDTHAPALLEEGLYHADGQILGEVYEYGSFIQSRMHRAGVTCSDCHEPHALALRKPGNVLCAQCHVPAKFDAPAHHHHAQGSEGARCVSCHMPARAYMIVDPRRDHAFGVPSPALSLRIGTPNACNTCHADRSPEWAVEKFVAWYGPSSGDWRSAFAGAIDAGRRGSASAEKELAALASDPEQPGIARATALSLLPEYLGPASLPALRAAISDADPLVRAAALAATEAMPMADRPPLSASSLRDPVRLVRLAAARALAGSPVGALTPERQADLERAIEELVASELVNAERPESHVNLANLYAQAGRPDDAEAALRTALRLDPRFVPALVNLADLARAQGRDDEGLVHLEEALRIAPENAEVLHALGLLRVRQGRGGEGVELLGRASALRLESTRFAYVYAVGLDSTGDRAGAIRVLEGAHGRTPADREVLLALVSYEQEGGDSDAALGYARKLLALSPQDAEAEALVRALEIGSGANPIE